MKKSDPPIIVQQIYNANIANVWSAITELDQMQQWFFPDIPDFRPEVGFKTKFIVELEDSVFPHMWKITEVIPEKKIVYDWRYENYTGFGLVCFELFEKGDKTILQLTSTVIDDFPEEIPQFKWESGFAGWSWFIQTSLKAHLNNKTKLFQNL